MSNISEAIKAIESGDVQLMPRGMSDYYGSPTYIAGDIAIAHARYQRAQVYATLALAESVTELATDSRRLREENAAYDQQVRNLGIEVKSQQVEIDRLRKALGKPAPVPDAEAGSEGDRGTV